METTRWVEKNDITTLPYWSTEHAIAVSKFAVGADRILEYGAGGSSLWLDQIVDHASIVTIDHDKEWIERCVVVHSLLEDIGFKSRGRDHYWYHESDLSLYTVSWTRSPFNSFDLIIVDGEYTTRVACMKAALDLLTPGGVVILHDSQEKMYREGIKFFLKMGGKLMFELEEKRRGWSPRWRRPTSMWFGRMPN